MPFAVRVPESSHDLPGTVNARDAGPGRARGIDGGKGKRICRPGGDRDTEYTGKQYDGQNPPRWPDLVSPLPLKETLIHIHLRALEIDRLRLTLLLPEYTCGQTM